MSERETVSCQPPSVGKKALLGPGPRRSLGGKVCCLSESGVYIVIRTRRSQAGPPAPPSCPEVWPGKGWGDGRRAAAVLGADKGRRQRLF